MKFYIISDDYIDYLRQYDSKVCLNKSGKRPYIGIVLQINELKYYVPLASPKPKHRNMKNKKDFHKIASGDFGVINFNNMIPVKDELLCILKIEEELNEQYKNLLKNQYNWIRNNKNLIKRKANNLYILYTTDNNSLSNNELSIKNNCCNFIKLEELCKQYSPLNI